MSEPVKQQKQGREQEQDSQVWTIFEKYMRSCSFLGYDSLNDQQKTSLYSSWQIYLKSIDGTLAVNHPQCIMPCFLHYLKSEPQSQSLVQSMPQFMAVQFAPLAKMSSSYTYGDIGESLIKENDSTEQPKQKDEIWNNLVRQKTLYFESKLGKLTKEDVTAIIETAIECEKVTGDSCQLTSTRYVRCTNPPFQVIRFIVFNRPPDYSTYGWKLVNKQTINARAHMTQRRTFFLSLFFYRTGKLGG